jgi:hypothetical protein
MKFSAIRSVIRKLDLDLERWQIVRPTVEAFLMLGAEEV